MDSSSSSSDDEVNFYTHAAAKLEELSRQAKKKTRNTRRIIDDEDIDNCSETNSPLQLIPKTQNLIEVSDNSNSIQSVELKDLHDKNETCETNDVEEDVIMFIDDNSSNDNNTCVTPRRSNRSRKRKNNITDSIKVVERVDIERILDDSLDNSFQLSQDENDSYVLIGSPPTKESNDDDNYEISVKILWKSNKMERFEMKKFETFQKVFLHFAKMEGVHEDQILIRKKGKRITSLDTPASIDWSILDILDGGVVSVEVAKKKLKISGPEAEQENNCKIKIQTSERNTISVTLKKDDTFKIVLKECSKKLDIPESKIKLFFDGDTVDVSETPETLDLDEEACFDLKILA